MLQGNETTSVRIRKSTLAAIIALPLLAVGIMQAFGQDASFSLDRQEYVVYEPDDLIFVSVDLAAQFLTNRGRDGWIVPDGTQILVHTFEPGSGNQYTRYLIAPAGSFDDARRHLILRRPAR